MKIQLVVLVLVVITGFFRRARTNVRARILPDGRVDAGRSRPARQTRAAGRRSGRTDPSSGSAPGSRRACPKATDSDLLARRR